MESAKETNPVIRAAQRRTSLAILAVQLHAGRISQEEYDRRIAAKEEP
mgnify:CR=1 FL=1